MSFNTRPGVKFWKVYIYAYGWFYISKDFPGVDFIRVDKNQKTTVYIGKRNHA